MTASDRTPVAIVPYTDDRAGDFARLNLEWLEGHGLLEDGDRKHLDHPRQSILDHGGAIFFATVNDEIVGTCGILHCGEGTYELVKLAVTSRARGHGAGRKLVETSLAWARAQGAWKFILVSSTKLKEALRLYERLGFEHRPLPAATGYATADVYMERTAGRDLIG